MKLTRSAARALGFFLAAALSTQFSEASATYDCIIREVKATNQRLSQNDFAISRTLIQYMGALGDGFGEKIKTLRPDQKWVDYGAGFAAAHMDYLTRIAAKNPALMPKTMAISYKKPPVELLDLDPRYTRRKVDAATNQKWWDDFKRFEESGHFKYLEGRYVEDIPTSEIGTVELATDLYGPASYTHRLSDLMTHYLSTLNPGSGRLLMLTSNLEAHQTIIKLRSGQEVTLGQWLSTVEGIEAKVVQQSMSEETIEIRKVPGKTVRVPKLKLVGFTDSFPPRRVFEEIREGAGQ